LLLLLLLAAAAISSFVSSIVHLFPLARCSIEYSQQLLTFQKLFVLLCELVRVGQTDGRTDGLSIAAIRRNGSILRRSSP